MRYLTTFLSLTLLMSCALAGPTSRPITILTHAGEYPAHGMVQLSFKNETSQTLSLNMCRATLQQRVGGQWNRLQTSTPHSCKDNLENLAPGELRESTLPLPPEATSGTFRYEFENIYLESGALAPASDRVSNPFQIRPPVLHTAS